MEQRLDNWQLFSKAPSIFATEPYNKMSARYGFIPTINVIGDMRKEGFFPVQAGQSTSRIEGKSPFTKHMVRFRHVSHLDIAETKQEVPEVILVNSHDGTSSYQLHIGLFRFVCMNGMICQSADFGNINVRHSKNVIHDVIEGSYDIVKQAPELLDRIEQFKTVTVNPYQQLTFAKAAQAVKWGVDENNNSLAPFKPHHLLELRRSEDAPNTLWNTFNTVQENIMKGGISGRSKTNRKTKTRGVKAVSENIRVNKALWIIAEDFKNRLTD